MSMPTINIYFMKECRGKFYSFKISTEGESNNYNYWIKTDVVYLIIIFRGIRSQIKKEEQIMTFLIDISY